MPDFLAKYAAQLGILLLACAVSAVGSWYVTAEYKDAKHAEEKAAAIALAATEKARIATEHAQALSKYQEKEKNYEKARTDLAAANRGLLNTIAGYRRSAPFTVPSNPQCPANDLLELCGRAYQEVALRGGERTAECAKELGLMAGKAEEERGKVELSNSLYESIRKRK